MAHEEIRTFVATGLRAALFASVLTLAACGSDSSSVDASALPEVTNPPATTTAPEPDNTTEKPPEDSVEGVTRFWIKPDLVDCVGEAPQRCMQIAEAEDGEYFWFYDQIAGFEFTEGISYVLDVRIEDVFDPPADASSLSYTLVEVISES